jgi:hypothetical protein
MAKRSLRRRSDFFEIDTAALIHRQVGRDDGGNDGSVYTELRVMADRRQFLQSVGAVLTVARGVLNATARVDPRTLTGKVMCGYQGWFTAEGDGSGRGWFHYTFQGEPRPGNCKFDLWPDLSEFDSDEVYPTKFKHANGRAGLLFSSMNRKTVLRHFKWMHDYGIDGVFLQRYPEETKGGPSLRHADTVLAHCRESANAWGRVYALMYATLAGKGHGDQLGQIQTDWMRLVDHAGLTRDHQDHAYLRHKGKPLVAIWGIGFDDERDFSLDQASQLIEFFKHDRKYGGCAIKLGVPTGWRTLDRDSVRDPALHTVIRQADVISPWTVGRYNLIDGAARHAEQDWKNDIAWCKAHSLDYMPVAFPGCSWHNMYPKYSSDMIPRQKGKFFWRQFVGAREAGARTLYVAMFDEIDEGTAVFKCTNDVPIGGGSEFITFEGLPSDWYLRLAGEGARMLRGLRPTTSEVPIQPR